MLRILGEERDGQAYRKVESSPKAPVQPVFLDEGRNSNFPISVQSATKGTADMVDGCVIFRHEVLFVLTWEGDYLEDEAKTKEFVNVVRKIIKTKRTPRDAQSATHRSFDDALDPCILAGLGQNAEELWIQPLGEV